jgi:eukaryotic-like serine/threonine-protein kinase
MVGLVSAGGLLPFAERPQRRTAGHWAYQPDRPSLARPDRKRLAPDAVLSLQLPTILSIYSPIHRVCHRVCHCRAAHPIGTAHLVRGIMLGQLLGARYRVIEILGSGGFGRTYIAEDTQRPRHPQCVLKHLSFSSPNANLLMQARRMFHQEAETLEQLGQHDQIPRLLAYFEENAEFYLVQELITGHALSEELKLKKLSEAEVTELLRDVLGILDFIHDKGVIHRDIKPENLIRRSADHKLVLIDFGAVKTIDLISTAPQDSGVESNYSMPVYTSGYAASEQCLGKPRFTSDLYSLGMIGIQALTSIHPTRLPSDPLTGELTWQDLIQVEEPLKTVLTRLTQFHFNQRYASARLALAALSSAPIGRLETERLAETPAPIGELPSTQLQSGARVKRTALVVGAGLMAGLAAWGVSQRPGLQLFSKLPATTTNQQISLGERVLLQPPIARKQTAVEQLAKGDYKAAIQQLEIVRQSHPADPEALIYLNNARIGNGNAYGIAAVVPLGTNPKSAEEVLRGVAQAQQQVNAGGGIQGVPLKVTLADDQNNPEVAQQIAAGLVADPQILGVVGHGNSDTTLAAAERYKGGELVAIAPLSSATSLTGFSPYLFRTMPSDRVAAKHLAEYLIKTLKKRRVAVFYNAANAYSKSLKSEIKDALYYGGQGEIVAEVDLNKPDFDAADSFALVQRQKAEVIMLASNGEWSDRAITIANVNRNRLPLLAGDALFSNKTLRVGGPGVVGMVLAVPAQQVSLEQSPFQRQATALWQGPVTWRSALAFDATQALVAALGQASSGQSPSRKGVRGVLADPKFQTAGSTQGVQFSEAGDRQGAMQLVKVQLDKDGKAIFKPIP